MEKRVVYIEEGRPKVVLCYFKMSVTTYKTTRVTTQKTTIDIGLVTAVRSSNLRHVYPCFGISERIFYTCETETVLLEHISEK
jgi:hypothetical protein